MLRNRPALARMVAERAETAGVVMTSEMLRDLALLFVIESELTSDDDEAARLGQIADELDARADTLEESFRRFREDIRAGARDVNREWGFQ